MSCRCPAWRRSEPRRHRRVNRASGQPRVTPGVAGDAGGAGGTVQTRRGHSHAPEHRAHVPGREQEGGSEPAAGAWAERAPVASGTHALPGSGRSGEGTRTVEDAGVCFTCEL